MTNSYDTVENALLTIKNITPYIIEGASFFYPPLKALEPFLPLIKVAIEGVNVVAHATGNAPEQATQEVINHLTPGMPNSDTLSQQAIDFQSPKD